MHDLDWSLIRTFLTVLDQGSFMSAARHLHLSQPTLTRHVAQLERQVGADLFERHGRGVTPTQMALRLAAAARAMEHASHELSRTIAATHSSQAGSVRITASAPVAVHLLPPVLTRMRRVLPDIRVELVASNAVSNLLRREADIAIRMVRPRQNTLIARKLGEVRMGAWAHRSYLQRRGTPAQLQDLLSHDLIGGDTDTAVMDGLRAMGHPVGPEQFVLRCDDLIVQWQAVASGLGIGFVSRPASLAGEDVLPVLEGRLRIPALPMWLAVHREIRHSPSIRKVYDFLASELPLLL